MKYLRLIWRVARRLVWETAMDNTTGLAAQMAYVLLFALAPGTLFLWHLLGLFGTDPTKLHRMYLLLRSFMPPDPKVQDILDSAIASVVVTGTSGLLANAGIILGIYFGTVFIATVSRALSQMHGVEEDRHWWSKYIISFFMLFWFGIQRRRFRRKAGRHCRGKLATLISAPAVDSRVESAVDRRGAGRARACALPSHAGKLFDRSSGAAGRNFLCGRLDHRDETFPALRGTIRSL